VKFSDFERYCDRMARATGKRPDKNPVGRAKLLMALRPEPSELFFCQRLVLVEGTADRAYISGALHLCEQWDRMRRAGLHIIPTEGKSEILQLLLVAQELSIPCFVIFDADSDCEARHRPHHERDNRSLFSALNIPTDNVFPTCALWGESYAIWPTNIEKAVAGYFMPDDLIRISNAARASIDPGAGLKKNPIFIGEFLSRAWSENKKPIKLLKLVHHLAKFGSAVEVYK
jgi:putative ATP-dependent endonuclease of the OLD family